MIIAHEIAAKESKILANRFLYHHNELKLSLAFSFSKVCFPLHHVYIFIYILSLTTAAYLLFAWIYISIYIYMYSPQNPAYLIRIITPRRLPAYNLQQQTLFHLTSHLVHNRVVQFISPCFSFEFVHFFSFIKNTSFTHLVDRSSIRQIQNHIQVLPDRVSDQACS